jgi:DNA polymerase
MDIKAINRLYEIDFPHLDIVTGEGNPHARIMLIGEAPGREEVEQKKPFVGKAGKNLSEFLDAIGLKREDIFISNAVKFRPTTVSEYGSISNRAPTEEEIKTFLPYLLKEIEVIAPEIIVTLGNTPLKALLGDGAGIGKMHGKLTSFKNIKLYPLYHPAAIIYNTELKEVYLKDVLNLKNYI